MAETDLSELISELASQRAAIEGLQQGDERLTEAIKDLRSEIGRMRDGVRIPAATWIAAGSLSLLIGTLTIGPLYGRIDEWKTEGQEDLNVYKTEVNRRFVEDVADRFARQRIEFTRELDRHRNWLLNIDQWREAASQTQGECKALLKGTCPNGQH